MLDFFVWFQIVSLFDSFSENVWRKRGAPCWFDAMPRTNRLKSHRPSFGWPYVIWISSVLKSDSYSFVTLKLLVSMWTQCEPYSVGRREFATISLNNSFGPYPAMASGVLPSTSSFICFQVIPSPRSRSTARSSKNSGKRWGRRSMNPEPLSAIAIMAWEWVRLWFRVFGMAVSITFAIPRES